MKTLILPMVCGVGFLLVLSTNRLTAQSSAISYQGRLLDSGSPATGSYDLEFALHDSETGGSQVGPTVTRVAVVVQDGLFTVALDFGAGPFDGAPRWLEIGVRPAGSASPYVRLAPRTPITFTPYAITALSAASFDGTLAEGQLPATYGGAVNFSSSGNRFAGDGSALTDLNANALTGGAVPADALDNAWKTGGNAGTAPGTHFLGTTDNQPLELRVNGQLGLKLQPAPDTPNLLNGGAANAIAPGVRGASILGGNTNQIGAGADYSMIGGGVENTANGPHSVIAGGEANRTTGLGAMVPGGRGNAADADFTFAAGHRAINNHEGSFVWADFTHEDFAAIADNEFAVRAGGGVRLVTSGAGMTVDGAPVLAGTVPDSALGANVSLLGASIESGEISNGAVLTAKLADAAVTSTKLADAAVTSAKLSGGAVISSTIADGSVATSDLADASVTSAKLANNSVTGAKIANGTVQSADLDLASFQGTFWSMDGNAGTSPGTDFLGTVDNQALELRVNGQRALRLEPATSTFEGDSPNVVAGHSGNQAWPSAGGATVGGGGSSAFGNTVAVDFGTVSGGIGNFAGGHAAVIGGGTANEASGPFSVVTGGWLNRALGSWATVIGGDLNAAVGDYSVASGRRAKAEHRGSFVWADSQEADFLSTTSNQFNIRASGGARFVGPDNSGSSAAIVVESGPDRMLMDGNELDSTGNLFLNFNSGNNVLIANPSTRLGIGLGLNLPAHPVHHVSGAHLTAAGVWTSVSDRNAKEDFASIDPEEVLARVVALPVTQWRYRLEPEGVKHIGPVAQDFQAAFGLGESAETIGSVDADGVALAAIQGLNRRMDNEAAALRAENAELKSELAQLRAQLMRFETASLAQEGRR